METNYLCRLESKTQIADGIYDFVVNAPEIAKNTVPGQFLHVLCSDKVFLRRPISICDAYEDKVRFIFEAKGEGTAELAKKQVGDNIDIMGPLGNCFVNGVYKKPVVIGGGIGVFPLFKLTKLLDNPEVFLGFRSKDRVVMEEEFSAVANTHISTDDGSYGYNGYAAAMLEEYLDNNKCDVIYSCGPTPMLRAVKKIAESRNIPCRVSLEQRMGCGIGACLVCSCETIFSGTNKYRRVCKDGPVFDSKEVNI
ncbi:MAG: dihydroorotate dehydrogenase electron transfer subunit [Eubacteriales bacterium]|nr:dihydroorotate dehydrogenase electron transfer subunit [Eubacteriales bacterium]